MKNIYKINDSIYITSDEEIKEGDIWYDGTNIRKDFPKSFINGIDKKIILTTDQDLIKDGVAKLPQQEISDGAKDTADYIDRHLVAALVQHSIAIEISDEEIEKNAKYWYNKEGCITPSKVEVRAWVKGAKWYREQLKSKGNGKN
jgi:hypothetical protein